MNVYSESERVVGNQWLSALNVLYQNWACRDWRKPQESFNPDCWFLVVI